MDKTIEKYDEIVRRVWGKPQNLNIDFSDTQTAFAHLSDKELKRIAWMFGLMNKGWLVKLGSPIGMFAARLNIGFIERIIKNTIFELFCGGTSLLESQPSIDKLYASNVYAILDYGAEGKEREEDFNQTMTETIRALEFAARNESVPMVSSKVTGLTRNGLLEKISRGGSLSEQDQADYQSLLKRLDSMCYVAAEKKVALAFDAEESWMQQALDDLVNKMMARYNKEAVVVYNTFQMYRHDRLAHLKASHEMALEGGYLLGAKLVRGAYMEKERRYAQEQGRPSPIHPDKAATDQAYDSAVAYCVAHYETIGFCNATHNEKSNMLQAKLMAEHGIDKHHPHLLFCQLYGMSDNLTFNLAKAGYRVAKYLPYGPVRDVIPYLIRRAQENTAVTGDVSRELQLVQREMARRGLK